MDTEVLLHDLHQLMPISLHSFVLNHEHIMHVKAERSRKVSVHGNKYVMMPLTSFQ